MEKGWVIGIVIVVVLIVLGVYFFYPSSNSNCAGQGEWFDFTDTAKPNKCCEGLVNVHSTDSVSVADKCYWIGTESGYPGGVCSDCGNGICEDVESVCGCAKDCVGKDKSDYNTIEEFCISSEWENIKEYCEESEYFNEEPICNLCQ